ncbi:putative acetyltransferase [Desulfosporosinus acididurans]|uniref:Putative acetyltransferase n=1 Tax=Desulfosporosinus acididurans TaxID=476652 RepID=A0A0J1FSS6_9FIRM|nr:GNAT family N-acetyltransferase [Desulfosporosinus acididurans]KLU66013.1 putative acetyltransferase [Desulfosporosinus acididurans]
MTDRSPRYKIRRANQGDIGGMVNLLKLLFSLESDFSFDELAQQRGLEMMLGDTGVRCVMVAESLQQIIGMCSAQMLVSTAEGGIVALIEDVVVEETWREQGLGRELLSSIEAWAQEKGASRLQLLADRNNTPALAFYQKMNWKTTRLICLRKGGRSSA